jgi:hypothetical protein
MTIAIARTSTVSLAQAARGLRARSLRAALKGELELRADLREAIDAIGEELALRVMCAPLSAQREIDRCFLLAE